MIFQKRFVRRITMANTPANVNLVIAVTVLGPAPVRTLLCLSKSRSLHPSLPFLPLLWLARYHPLILHSSLPPSLPSFLPPSPPPRHTSLLFSSLSLPFSLRHSVILSLPLESYLYHSTFPLFLSSYLFQSLFFLSSPALPIFLIPFALSLFPFPSR